MRLFCNNFILLTLTSGSGASSLRRVALNDRDVPALLAKVQKVARGLALSDEPWDDLKAKLDPTTVLLDTIPESAYQDECIPAIANGAGKGSGENRYIVQDQPSGVCMMDVNCGLENCGLEANDEDIETLGEKTMAMALAMPQGTDFTKFDPINNPSYNLPSQVLFPQTAGDVAAAINFAKEHSIEISIKNSGHNYNGASTKKDTLLLNMRNYEQYSSTGIVECSDQQDAVMEQDLSNQACKLALSRKKKAFIRVGGGENWGQVYASVNAFNELQDIYKYHVVGGGAASVSPMGWTWQGGLSGTTAGRKFGFGVDQVLQIEMILPNGLHVRFGPVSWEDTDGFVYPRTTKVSGVCKENSTEADNNVGIWGPCQDNINFDDLWFAQLGGGGGTWGVVLSVQLQLHDFANLDLVDGYACEEYLSDPTAFEIYLAFLIDVYLDPSAIGLSEDESNSCGSSTEFYEMFCYGEGAADAAITAWKSYISGRNQILEDGGLSYEQIDDFSNCRVLNNENKDLAEYKGTVTSGPYEGRVKSSSIDSGLPTPFQNFILPKKWILANKDKAISLIIASMEFTGREMLYPAFGGYQTSDQANSFSDAQREGGVMLFIPYNVAGFITGVDVDTFYSGWLQEMYDFTDKNNFPAYLGSNHIVSATLGPLKSDWSKPCPINWTEKEREEKCVPVQEAVYGTGILGRLEAIKETIDPNYMFDCNRCVGNNRARVTESSPGPDSDVEEGVEAENDRDGDGDSSYDMASSVDSGDDSSSHDIGDDYKNCKTDELKNIRGIACSNKDIYNTMCDLMKAVDLDYELASGMFTAFFPTDDAFAAIESFTKNARKEQIANIVKFHFHEGKAIQSKDLECSGLLKMTNGNDSRTKCEGGKRYQKGLGNYESNLQLIPIISKENSDIETCNGIVHTIDAVMLPAYPYLGQE